MAEVIGLNTRVEVAATYGSAVAVTGVTKANPAVVSKTSHGLSNDTVGYFSTVAGMVQLEDQAFRIKNSNTDDFECQGLDTTTYSTFTSGNIITVSTWSTLSEATSWQQGGGTPNPRTVTRLIDVIARTRAGLLSEQTISLNIYAQESPSAAMDLLTAAARTQGKVVMRITLSSGDVRVFRAEPSLPTEDVNVDDVGSGTLAMTIKGFYLALAA